MDRKTVAVMFQGDELSNLNAVIAHYNYPLGSPEAKRGMYIPISQIIRHVINEEYKRISKKPSE